jgi:hypothetical protein
MFTLTSSYDARAQTMVRYCTGEVDLGSARSGAPSTIAGTSTWIQDLSTACVSEDSSKRC